MSVRRATWGTPIFLPRTLLARREEPGILAPPLYPPVLPQTNGVSPCRNSNGS